MRTAAQYAWASAPARSPRAVIPAIASANAMISKDIARMRRGSRILTASRRRARLITPARRAGRPTGAGLPGIGSETVDGVEADIWRAFSPAEPVRGRHWRAGHGVTRIAWPRKAARRSEPEALHHRC